MTRKIAVWIVVCISTLTMSAPGIAGVAETDPTSPASVNARSSKTCSNINVAKNESQPFAGVGFTLVQTDACADPIDRCNDPVRYLGANGDCACFACEYGKSTQHNVCTRNQSDKNTLLRRAR